MSVFSKKTDHNNTAQIVEEINDLLNEMRKPRGQGSQKGGNSGLVSEVNHLLSDLQGEEIDLSERELMEFALNGGAKKLMKKPSKKVTKSKSKSKGTKKPVAKKTTTKSKSKSKSKSKGKMQTRPKMEAKSKSKSKSKSNSRPKRNMKREEGDVKPKRKANKYFTDLLELKAFIKTKLPNENINNVGAMTKVGAKLLSENDKDLEKAKKAFDSATFMRNYNIAKKEMDVKKEAKKAAKA
jgi:hypothetical protein